MVRIQATGLTDEEKGVDWKNDEKKNFSVTGQGTPGKIVPRKTGGHRIATARLALKTE